MFQPTQDMKRKTFRNKTARRVSLSFWLSVLIGLLLLGNSIGPVCRNANAGQQQLTITLTVKTSDSGCIVPFEKYPIKFNDSTLTTESTYLTRDLQISPGRNVISISLPEKPTVKVAKVEVVYTEENKQTYLASEGTATVDFDRSPDNPIVVVYLSGLCGDGSKDDEKAKEVNLIVSSWDCISEPVWEGFLLKIDEQQFDVMTNREFFAGSFVRKHIKIGPQRHSINVSSREFPKTTIDSVMVKKMLTGAVVKGPFTPDASGFLYEDLGEKVFDSHEFALEIRIWGNCENPKTDPSEFAIVTVKAISGDVEVVEPRSISDRAAGLKPASRTPNAGEKYRRGTIIKTGKDGLIVLASEYMHTISIDSSTQVTLDELMTSTGRKQLSAFLKRGKIKIERKGRDVGDDSTQTTVQTDTATVSSTHTIYSVSYDESTKLTTVGVEEGRVAVFPENETLQSITLTANQQVQVSDKKIGATSAGIGDGSTSGEGATNFLLYVGIGIGGLVGLIVLLGVIYLVYRRLLKAKAVQPAIQSSGIKVDARTGTSGVPQSQPMKRRCPRCGTALAASKKFCTACGLALN